MLNLRDFLTIVAATVVFMGSPFFFVCALTHTATLVIEDGSALFVFYNKTNNMVNRNIGVFLFHW